MADEFFSTFFGPGLTPPVAVAPVPPVLDETLEEPVNETLGAPLDDVDEVDDVVFVVGCVDRVVTVVVGP